MTVSDKNLTVVYTINDSKSFEGELERIRQLFTTSEGRDWAITAYSRSHELNRLDLIQEAIDSDDIDVFDLKDVIRDIFSIVNTEDFKDLGDFLSRFRV